MQKMMKKARVKYQPGGPIKSDVIKKSVNTAKKAVKFVKSVDDKIESLAPSLAKNPVYKGAKSAAKSTLKYLGLMQKGGAMKDSYTFETGNAADGKITKRGYGGKAPVASDYMGNPMGYYADKAAYGREMARQKMMQDGRPYDSNFKRK